MTFDVTEIFVSSKKNRGYQLTTALLRGYRKAAVDNARELLYEATLLLRNNHFARGYFLSVTAVEEIGKAVQAFDALGRNVSDPEVSVRVRLNFEDYPKRIIAAAFPLMQMAPELRADVVPFFEMLIESKRSSEPALYMGIDPHSARITSPNALVSPYKAERTRRLAQLIFDYAAPHVMDSPPKLRTRAEDEFFAMKSAVLVSMTHNADFWQYYASVMKNGDVAFEAAVSDYSKKYVARDRKFRDEIGPEPHADA